MSLGAILIMSFITIFLGFGCALVIDDFIRQTKKQNSRHKYAKK